MSESPPSVQRYFEEGRKNNYPVIVERDLNEPNLPPWLKGAFANAQAVTVNGFRVEYAKDGKPVTQENLTHELTHTAYSRLTKTAPHLVQQAIDEASKIGSDMLTMAFKKSWATKNPPTNDQDYDVWSACRDVRRMAGSVKRYLKSGKTDVTGSLELSLMIPPYSFRKLGNYLGNKTEEAGDQWHVVALYSGLCKKYGVTVDPVYQGEELVTYKAGKDKAYAEKLFATLSDGKAASFHNDHHDALGRFAPKDSVAVGEKSGPVPAEPGSTPLKPGHIRLYHYSNPNDADKKRADAGTPWSVVNADIAQRLREQGIDMGKAKGVSYGEPNAVWASCAKPDPGKVYAEFSVPHDDQRFALGKPHDLDDAQRMMKSGNDVAFNGSIRADELIAVHEPWHHRYRYLAEHPDLQQEAVAGEFDHLLDDDSYGPAVAKAKLDFKPKESPNV